MSTMKQYSLEEFYNAFVDLRGGIEVFNVHAMFGMTYSELCSLALQNRVDGVDAIDFDQRRNARDGRSPRARIIEFLEELIKASHTQEASIKDGLSGMFPHRVVQPIPRPEVQAIPRPKPFPRPKGGDNPFFPSSGP